MQVRGWGAVTPGTIGYSPELDPFPYGPDKARQLLAEAGYKTPTNPDGKDFGKLIVNTWVSTALPLMPESAQLGADFWRRELGIDAEVRVGDETGLKKGHNAGDLNGEILWRDNETRIDATGITRGSSYGISDHDRRSHNDPELFDFAIKSVGVFNPEERPKVLNKLYRRLRDEQCEIGLGYVNIPWAVGPRILTWEPFPLAFFPTAMHKITLE